MLDWMIFSVPNAHILPLGTWLHSDFQDLLELYPTISRFGPRTVCDTLGSELPEDRNYVFLTCTLCLSESEVAQSCPTLSDPMDYSLPGYSIHGIFQARVLEGGAIAFSNSANAWSIIVCGASYMLSKS